MQHITINKKDKLGRQAKEAYNELRTNIEDSGKKVIAITSCIPNEGKSSVSMNLAQSLAELGYKVLLIDADMRKSEMDSVYKIEGAKKGLSHYLPGKCKIEEIVSKTNIDNFYMIPVGKLLLDPTDLISQDRFSDLIKKDGESPINLRKLFDYIIIDCPPRGGNLVDSQIIGKLCDGVLMVIASGQIGYKFAQRVKKQFEDAGCNIIGVILNKVELKRRGYYGNYYGGYYNGYYGNDGKN